MSKKPVWFLFLASAGIAILTLGLSLLLLKLQSQNSFSSYTQSQTSPDHQKETINIDEEAIEEKIDTSDWKTYRNEEYGFELKYPIEKIRIKPPSKLFGDEGGFSIQFMPVDKNIHTESALSLGGLIYSNKTTPEYMHVARRKSFQENVDRILKNGNVKSYDILNNNGLRWFCFTPLKTKMPSDIKAKICLTENSDEEFYQIDFLFDSNTEKYFSENDFDELIRSFNLFQ